MKQITTYELKAMRSRSEELTLINVLPSEKFERTRIPDAINIPVELDEFVDEVRLILRNSCHRRFTVSRDERSMCHGTNPILHG